MQYEYKPHTPIETVKGGSALAVGSAPCVYDEVREALDHRPGATIFCANKAVKAIKPDHICSFHCDEIAEFKQMAFDEWGEIEPITHSAAPTGRHERLADFPDVDFWWLTARQMACVSGWFAARVAQAYGYDEIIMCGSPMSGGDGYFPGDDVPTTANNPRFGHYPEGHGTLKTAQDVVAETRPEWRAGIVSMSGFTRKVLGGPIWQ